MKQIAVLFFSLILILGQSKSQTLSPDQNQEYCPNINYNFVITVSGTVTSITASSGAILVSSNANTFIGKFSDANVKQTFTVYYTDNNSNPRNFPFEFKKIKSLLHSGSCSFLSLSSIQAPLCQIANIPYSFTAQKWYTAFESPEFCFGTINTYEYLLPIGWKINNGPVSTGSNWQQASNSVTFTPNAATGGSIQVRAINSGCLPLSAFRGPTASINISRPNPTFTIFPLSVSMTCGTIFTKTFTISTTGTLACPVTYSWNLGANNGWLYDAGSTTPTSPAPTTPFTTTTNSITLKSANPYQLPSNVTVTPGLNGVNQLLLTSTLSLAPLPIYVVNGDNIVCATSNNYFVPTLPAGATVQWQAVPSNIVTINSPTATQTTITKGYNSGIVTLIATITNQCGQVGQAYKYDISVGSGVSSLEGRYYLNDPSQPHNLLTYYGGINYIPSNTICNVFIDNPGLESATWSLVSGNTNFWTQFTEGSNHILQMHLPYSNEDIVTFRLTNTNTCGAYDFDVLFVAQWQYGGYYTISPNPTKDNLIVSVDEAKLVTQKIAKSSDQNIREIVILDKTGMVLAKQTYSKGTRQVNKNISNLKTGIYIIRIFNGKKWTALKLVKE
ncbi:T9SS type A sorting domain-containing protein [Ferruginibacter sp.]|nr:T9SS type A sorting domain-containing protein [Ferruginibacter sp.]